MSSTCNRMLDSIYARFVPLIREASLVVMCQDGVSLPDVQLYTEVDCVQADNRENVACVKFEKPLVVHPIYWTDDLHNATRNLLQCYRNAFSRIFLDYVSSFANVRRDVDNNELSIYQSCLPPLH